MLIDSHRRFHQEWHSLSYKHHCRLHKPTRWMMSTSAHELEIHVQASFVLLIQFIQDQIGNGPQIDSVRGRQHPPVFLQRPPWGEVRRFEPHPVLERIPMHLFSSSEPHDKGPFWNQAHHHAVLLRLGSCKDCFCRSHAACRACARTYQI